MSNKEKWVRRFSVDETAKHKNGFTIYKITSVLFPIASPEAVTSVSVWKRYSDIQRLHKSMKSLHTGLHLKGTFPTLPRYSYFKRFSQEVINERSKTIKTLLEFVAEHMLLFTSTDFVDFLQTGYPEPEDRVVSVIDAIRSSLHLPIEETPPLEYQTDDDDSRSPTHQVTPHPEPVQSGRDFTDFISQIPVYEAADVEIRQSPIDKPTVKSIDSLESINSLDSIDSDLFDELNKVTIDKGVGSTIKKNILPDLINFDAPSTSTKYEDCYIPKSKESDTQSLNSNLCSNSSVYDLESRRSSSRVSMYSRSVLSLSNMESKTKTEDSYVFEAGYMLNLAARCESMGDYQRAFECYKSGIEKMLVGVQSDTDAQRRALIKEKTHKYLSYAEAIYKNHLCDAEQRQLLPERDDLMSRSLHCSIPITMLKRPYEDLALYRVLAILGSSIMLVLHQGEQNCYAMKVIRKVPKNLTEFDEYFLQRTNETRTPILPTVIPYMVPLHAYIETTNLIFLILAYAPGEKLFEYIKHYAKSLPTTPAREVNLENVFTEPKNQNIDMENDNIGAVKSTVSPASVRIGPQSSLTGTLDSDDAITMQVETETENNNVDEKIIETNRHDVTVTEMVLNSQKLLLNVDRALSNGVKTDRNVDSDIDRVQILDKEMNKAPDSKGNVTHSLCSPPHPHTVLPPSAVCKWGAEILTAIESLHNSGVICRDLNPSNILLGDGGQVVLTYFVHYPGADMCLERVRGAYTRSLDLHVAPELVSPAAMVSRDRDREHVCDYWSYGVIMYQLLCGVPLSYYHRSVFTSHTMLQMPDGLPLEVQSLLTQLLTYDPTERLGAGKDGIEEIKGHPYFKSIDWQSIYDNWVVPD